MHAPRAPSIRDRAAALRAACGLCLVLLLGGCLTGDFGRVNPSLVSDDVHDWVGPAASGGAGYAPSSLPLTDDERTLRDLAFPLIEPPYDRNSWDSVLLEWGINRSELRWPANDRTAYAQWLLGSAYRSTAARYAQLIDDVRNDTVRIDSFYMTALRVLDMDARRQRSMAYVSFLSGGEYIDAGRRMAENSLVIAWVQYSLRRRADAFQFALERCVLATPMPAAVDAERALNALRQQINTHTLAVPVPPPPAIAFAAAG
jgi:hypothetical protein